VQWPHSLLWLSKQKRVRECVLWLGLFFFLCNWYRSLMEFSIDQIVCFQESCRACLFA
jgi:hypothetical protein